MNIKKFPELAHQQIADLTERYRGLSCVSSSFSLAVSGKLSFSAQYNGVSIQDEYVVEITVPEDYPEILPTAKEIGGRISKDFHTYPDNTLCLGSPIETRIKFSKQETLLGFVEDLLIPFLYAYSYKEKCGEMPYGELSHGVNGILESYKGLFQINDDLAVIGFLKILADDNYRGHISCPCGSNIKLRNCHGDIVRELQNFQSPEQFLQESIHVLYCMKQQSKTIPSALLPQTLIKRVRRHRNKRH